MWTNKRFWLDSTWRAFRTFSQTLAALLAASFTGLLQATGQTANDGGIPHTPWLGFLYASTIAGLISLLQSIDRERAVTWVAGTIATTQQPETQAYSDPTPTAPLPAAEDETPPIAVADDSARLVRPLGFVAAPTTHGYGESLK
jgi:hypothetical protein